MVSNYTSRLQHLFQKDQKTTAFSTTPWYLCERGDFLPIMLGEYQLSLNPQQNEIEVKKAITKSIQSQVNKKKYDDALIDLKHLKKLVDVDTSSNVIDVFLQALVGLVSAIVGLVVGVFCIVPSFLKWMPYIGKSEFFYDVLKWFMNSVMLLLSCLILPIAIYHSVQTTGSINIFQGECSRIIDSLEYEIKFLMHPNKNLLYPATGPEVLPCMGHLSYSPYGV